jgi:hypothetical protein
MKGFFRGLVAEYRYDYANYPSMRLLIWAVGVLLVILLFCLGKVAHLAANQQPTNTHDITIPRMESK